LSYRMELTADALEFGRLLRADSPHGKHADPL
jgi:hypothetical protein